MQAINYYIEYVQNSNIILYESYQKVSITYTKISKKQRKNEQFVDFCMRDRTKAIKQTVNDSETFTNIINLKLAEGRTFEITSNEFYKGLYDLVNSPQ